MAKELTKKEAGFVRDFIKTGNGTKAAQKNYKTKSENTAASIASQNLRKLKVRKKIKTFADRIPDALLAKRHLELLNVPRKVRTIHKGEIDEEIEEVDTNALKAGLDMGYKLKGLYKADPTTPQTGTNETLESINILVKMLSEKRTKDKS